MQKYFILSGPEDYTVMYDRSMIKDGSGKIFFDNYDLSSQYEHSIKLEVLHDNIKI